MLEAAKRNQPVNNIMADQIVWQKLEEELLRIPTLKKDTENENNHHQP